MPGPPSSADTRSSATLHGFTDAIGVGDVHGRAPGAATYLRGSSSASPAASSAPSSAGTPTSISGPPPSVARLSTDPPARPVIVVRSGAGREHERRAMQLRALDAQLQELRRERRSLEEGAAARARSSWWPVAPAFALGVTVAALSSSGARWSLELAIGACLVAGLVTLGAALGRILAARRAGLPASGGS